jgi:hypothetical protein
VLVEDVAVEFRGAEGSWKSFNVSSKNMTDAQVGQTAKQIADSTVVYAIAFLPEGSSEVPTECERYKIQGNQACSFIVSSKPNPIFDQKMIMMSVLAKINGTVYSFSYGNNPNDFDKDLPMIEKMIASFKLVGTQPSPSQNPQNPLMSGSQENVTTLEPLEFSTAETGEVIEPGIIEGNKSEPMRWLTYNDPILQFTIEYPSTWDIRQNEDQISFEIPDTYTELEVTVEPLLTLDHSEYARDTLNERRQFISEIVGLNETSINGQPATMAQYDDAGTMALSYFMVTDDYTGYRLLYSPDFREDNPTQYMPMIDRMVNSFRITK